MVQAAASAPPKTLQTLDGLIMAKICDGDACVISQVECHLRIDDDGSWFVAYWDPSDPARNASAEGIGQCEVEVAGKMLAAIASLTPMKS